METLWKTVQTCTMQCERVQGGAFGEVKGDRGSTVDVEIEGMFVAEPEIFNRGISHFICGSSDVVGGGPEGGQGKRGSITAHGLGVRYFKAIRVLRLMKFKGLATWTHPDISLGEIARAQEKERGRAAGWYREEVVMKVSRTESPCMDQGCCEGVARQ